MSLLGRRVRWLAGGRLLEGRVLYEGEPWCGGLPPSFFWVAGEPWAAMRAGQRAWGRRRPASRSGLVVRAERVCCPACDGKGSIRIIATAPPRFCWACEGTGGVANAGRIYYAPRREALEVIE